MSSGYIAASQTVRNSELETVIAYLKDKKAFSQDTSVELGESVKYLYLKHRGTFNFIKELSDGRCWFDEQEYIKAYKDNRRILYILFAIIGVPILCIISIGCILISLSALSFTR